MLRQLDNHIQKKKKKLNPYFPLHMEINSKRNRKPKYKS